VSHYIIYVDLMAAYNKPGQPSNTTGQAKGEVPYSGQLWWGRGCRADPSSTQSAHRWYYSFTR